MLKKFTCTVLSVIVALLSAVCVTAASKADFSIENADEYFTLMNGCSRCCAAPAHSFRRPRACPRRRSAAAGRNRG